MRLWVKEESSALAADATEDIVFDFKGLIQRYPKVERWQVCAFFSVRRSSVAVGSICLETILAQGTDLACPVLVGGGAVGGPYPASLEALLPVGWVGELTARVVNNGGITHAGLCVVGIEPAPRECLP